MASKPEEKDRSEALITQQGKVRTISTTAGVGALGNVVEAVSGGAVDERVQEAQLESRE